MRSRLALPLVALLALATAAGCARPAHTPGAERPDRSVITRAQLVEHHFTTAFDAVQALHGNWLLPKGADSFAKPTEVQVYMDDVRLGGVQTLRTITTATVGSIRFIDGVQAAARWGLDHGSGAIVVSTGS